MVLFCCNLWPTYYEVIEMPPFVPNSYLFETHKDKANSKWEIFAWAVRDVMSKASGLAKHDQSQAEKNQYYKYLQGRSDTY